jgi:adenylate cyclase
VTVLFADVVRSMDIASQLETERLRELMAELFDRSAAVVQRYGGTVSQFTGDGIMAVFGAPTTLEDHAFRACLTALDIQSTTRQLAVDVQRHDGVTLQLRIGLNSGQVIAGEIGSGSAGYTTIGKQVGMAQRMESVAPPGGVMLGESTARLVETTVELGEPELVRVKGAPEAVPARMLLAASGRQPSRRGESKLVGRAWELNTVIGILDEAIGGAGCVVNIMGSPGIGKSRLVREATTIATDRSLPVYTTYCESHATDVPFHVVARFLRAAMGIDELEADAARVLAHAQFPDADPDDLVLLDDLLGIRDAAAALPDVAADARRRRLNALINAASLARDAPGVYVIEDAHWIDEASESMLAGFLSVIAHIPALMLITYRPEYHGVLSRVPDSQTIALRPLSDVHSSTLTTELVGSDPSVAELTSQVSARAAGNPFFLEEMVRDLAERGVLHGDFGAYRLHGDIGDASVPATLQATIGARIDRLGSGAKQTLNAAAVIGSRFDADLLSGLAPTVDVESLIEAQLVEQVRFTPRAEYGFRHPLIRTVAYESQLKSDRAQLHRRLAEAIQSRGSADENAALIAEHLEAAGDLHAAFDWHMRAGSWLTNRDIDAAQTSWQRARQVADRLPDDDPDRAQIRIGPRTLLAGTAWRVGGMSSDPGFSELSELCTATGDQRSLAVGMTGLVIAKNMNAHYREASDLGSELTRLLDAIGDPTLVVALSFAAIVAKNETAETAEMLRLAQRVIDLAEDDLTKGNLLVGSPLASALAARANARWCLGAPGWREDVQQAIAWSRGMDATTLSGTVWYTYLFAIPNGVLISDDAALGDSAEALAFAEQSGDDLALDLAQTARGLILVHHDGADHQAGLDLLEKTRQRAISERFALPPLALVNIHVAREKLRLGELDRAIELSSNILDDQFRSGSAIWSAFTTSVLVDALLQRRHDRDIAEARAAVERLATAPTDPGFVLNEIWQLRLRALLAQAQGDDATYRDYRDRYRKMAAELGFEGHMAWAEAMP